MRVAQVDPHEASASCNLLQSPFWARFKERTGLRTRTFRFVDGAAEGTVVAVERSAGSAAEHLYIPHGPELTLPEGAEGPFLLELSDAIAARLDSTPAFLRYDLPWDSPFDHQDLDRPPPDPRVRELRMNFGTGRRDLHKAPTDIQPPDTVIVRLDADDATLLARMKPKTRYNIRVCRRHGVDVAREGQHALPEWHRLHRRTCERQRIVSEGIEYFESLFGTAARDRSCCGSAAPEICLVTARSQGTMIAGLICALWKQKSYYLYGASAREHGRMMGPYGVQWCTMRMARDAGCRTYDMFGVPPNDDPSHPMHGLYRFKTGFGGQVRHYQGCWDYPLDERAYRAHAHAAASSGAYHLPG